MKNDRDAIVATIQKMTDALGRGDVDGVMATYESSAVVVGSPGEPITGDAALRAMFRELIETKARFTFGKHEVVQAGDAALHLMPWRMEGQGPDGAAMSGGGLSVAVLRSQSDGSWRMVIDNPYGDTALPK